MIESAWIFVGEGRLGNQIFQYVAMHKMGAAGKILAPGFGQLCAICEPLGPSVTMLLPKSAEKIFRRIIAPVLVRPLFRWLKMGTYIREIPPTWNRNDASPDFEFIQKIEGAAPFTYVDGGYFQNMSNLLTIDDFKCLKVRSEISEKANLQLRLADSRCDWRDGYVAIHVRRGDYLTHSSHGVDDIVLNEEYYEKAIEALELTSYAMKCRVVVTDDREWCLSRQSIFGDAAIVSNTAAIDFAILASATVSILSNSTYSLAAAMVDVPALKIIAPKYWFGRSRKEWLPRGIASGDPRFIYV
jgi:hypothetical protein